MDAARSDKIFSIENLMNPEYPMNLAKKEYKQYAASKVNLVNRNKIFSRRKAVYQPEQKAKVESF